MINVTEWTWKTK